MRGISLFLAGFLFAHGLSIAFSEAIKVFRIKEFGGLVTQTDQRAPVSSEGGVFWMYKDGSTIKLYIKDWVSGDWRGPVNF